MSVLLKKSVFEGVSSKELAQQIEAKKKCKKKLPTWFSTPKIYYPKKLNIEQTSSEVTALHKSQIVSGKSLVDLTGGFGVDSYFFSKKIGSVFHCEIDSDLAKITAHNFDILGAKNVEPIFADGIQFLKNSEKRFDWLYIDPSRRNDVKGKVFHLSDCLPDVTQHLDLFFQKSENILIKTAPLLDISSGIDALGCVKEVHIVAVRNEVKELLWVLKSGYSGEITMKTLNIKPEETQTFDFKLSEEKIAVSETGLPLTYLYEPNAAILKSGAFKLIGNKFSLKKIHQHTHLYTSSKLLDFPGRKFQIEHCIPYNKKTFKTLKVEKANIATRNFPESVSQIRKKFKISDGGHTYLFFFKDVEKNLSVVQGKKV